MTDLEGAALSAVAAHYLAKVEADVRACESLYEHGGREPAFWAMFDLRGSAAFRIAAGDRDAYVRVEIFTRLVRRLLGGYPQAVPFKELGDAVLVRSTDLRPLVETAVVLDMVARTWTANHVQDGTRLDARVAVTHGTAVRLDRDGTPDYVGASLDRLARLSGQTHPDDVVVLVDDDAHRQDGPALLAEYDGLTARGPLALDRTKLKAGERPVRYYELAVDRPATARARNNYRPMRRR